MFFTGEDSTVVKDAGGIIKKTEFKVTERTREVDADVDLEGGRDDVRFKPWEKMESHAR